MYITELSRLDDEHYVNPSRNILIKGKPRVREQVFLNKIINGRNAVVSVLTSFPDCVHDPSTFNTDVLKHDVSILEDRFYYLPSAYCLLITNTFFLIYRKRHW